MRWPRATEERAARSRAGLPSLLVVDRGVHPPVTGVLEDWIREDADERDVAVRLAVLRSRAGAGELAAAPAVPAVFDVGREGPAPLPLLPGELAPAVRRVARSLLVRAEHLVTGSELAAAASPTELADVLPEVRRALARLGWVVTAVGTGHLAEPGAREVR